LVLKDSFRKGEKKKVPTHYRKFSIEKHQRSKLKKKKILKGEVWGEKKR